MKNLAHYCLTLQSWYLFNKRLKNSSKWKFWKVAKSPKLFPFLSHLHQMTDLRGFLHSLLWRCEENTLWNYATFDYFLISLLSQHRLDYVRIRKGFLSWMAKMPEFPDEIYAIPPEMNNTEIYFQIHKTGLQLLKFTK